MGVKFDRILDAFDGPFEKVTGCSRPPAGKILGPAQPAGYLISHQMNDSFILVNRLLKNGDEVYWLKKPATVAGKQTWALARCACPRAPTPRRFSRRPPPSWE